MYTLKPTLGEQMLFHCEETLTRISTGMSAHCVRITALKEELDRLDTSSTPGFGTKKRRKQRPVSFDSVYVERAWGCETLTIKELINKLQTTLGKRRVKERK